MRSRRRADGRWLPAAERLNASAHCPPTGIAPMCVESGFILLLLLCLLCVQLPPWPIFLDSSFSCAFSLYPSAAPLPPYYAAYRLGKFLGGVNQLRKTRLHAPWEALEWIASGGELVYYFLEQGTW